MAEHGGDRAGGIESISPRMGNFGSILIAVLTFGLFRSLVKEPGIVIRAIGIAGVLTIIIGANPERHPIFALIGLFLGACILDRRDKPTDRK